MRGVIMIRDKAIIIFNNVKLNTAVDIEIPLNITANELIVGLNVAYNLGIDMSDIKNCYLKAENPIALLRGNKTLAQFGIHNGSIINYNELSES